MHSFQNPRLDLLPVELIRQVVGGLNVQNIKSLSCVSNRLRAICVPFIFHSMSFSSSEAGLNKLSQFAKSQICDHVVSFSYNAEHLLESGLCSPRDIKHLTNDRKKL
jgi:hypothetical protein